MMYHPCPVSLLPGGDTIATEITYEKQFTTVDDVWHDDDHLHDFYEIYINLGGNVSFRVGDRVYGIARGDMVLIPPNRLHRCLYHSDGIHEHFCIWINKLPLSDKKLAARFSEDVHVVLSDKDKTALIEHCFGLYENRWAEDALRFRAVKHFFGILDLICSGGPVSATAQNLPVLFTEILLHISRHFHESGFNVTALCQNFFISNSSLNRYFSTYFQTTPSQYIESCRFAEAKKLLQNGHSVQYTASCCGFSDCPYFVKRFHKKFGMTPLQYRKHSQQDLPE